MQKFSDLNIEDGDDVHLDGAKKNFEKEVVGQKIFVYAAKEMPSQYDSDQCVMLQFSFEEGGERFVTFTGSSVIAKQIEKCKKLENESPEKKAFPFETTVEKRRSKKGFFYTFT